MNYYRNYEHIAWGTDHPDYNSKATRIKFSSDEQMYMQSLVKQYCLRDNDKKYRAPSKFASFCLEKIKNDHHAIPIFHHRHVLNTERIRSLLRKWEVVS